MICSHGSIANQIAPNSSALTFVVRDHNGQALAYVYFEDESGQQSTAKVLTYDEVRRIAINIAKLPEPLKKP